MKMTLRKLGKWSSVLPLLGLALFGMTLVAQGPVDPADSSEQQTAPSTDKKPAPASRESAQRQPELGVAVDSARKSDVLATWITTEGNPGEVVGPYIVKQSAEFGGRITGRAGNTGTWDSFVNLGSGPRLLEYTLEVHSPNHTGLVFDDLLFSNFGYGGDPNNVSRIQAQKGKFYNFNASFRRDQNIFDYNLFANPLNPATSNPAVPILQSPHEFLMTRRMSDANLSLFPVGNVRLRVGWSRVVNEGTQLSSFHQGTEALLLQPTLNTTDNYTAGISLRFIPRTSLNYDQFYTYFKGDNTNALADNAPGSIGAALGLPNVALAGPGGALPVNLGISFNTLAGQPCATPVLGTGFVNPACNGFFALTRQGRNRNSFPTEQVSFQSNYFRPLDMSGRINYSDAEADLPDFAQAFAGLETRTRARIQGQAGSAVTHRISLTGDFAATYRVTDRFRIVEVFRYDKFSIPGSWGIVTATAFGATLLSNPNLFTPATCPPPFTAATCPQHFNASGPDVQIDNRSDFLRQDRKVNTFELEYDFTKRFGAHIGYRFERREITQNVTDFLTQTFFPGPTAALANRGACAPAIAHPLNPDGTCTVVVEQADAGQDFVQINGHTGLIGLNARPTDKLNISADAEFYSGDNQFFRITPRHLQDYRVRARYRAEEWATFGAAIRILENRNTSADIGNLQHNRSYGFNGAFGPPDAKWGLDLSYDYNDIFSQTNICFVATPVLTPPGLINCGTPFLSGLSVYTNLTHYGSGSLVLKPWKRVTAGLGYALTSTSGNTLILNPNAPTGPLNFNYHLPTASVSVDVLKNLTYKASWNNYDYNEKSNPGPTLPRDFHGNVFTISLRYSM